MPKQFVEYNPRNVNIDKTVREKYNELKESEHSPFEELTEIFFMAAIVGFVNKKRVPLKVRYPLINYQTGYTSEQKWLMKCMVISEKNGLEMLATEDGQREILKIVEEYANGGIKLLHYEVLGAKLGDYTKRLENELRSELTKSKGSKG